MAANLKAKISLDTSAFSRGISKVTSDVARVAGDIARTGAMFGAALGGAAFTGLAVGVKGALALGDSLSNLSARTGAPIKDLMLLQEAFKQADIGAEGVGPAINKMQKAITGINEQGEPTNKMFAQLGLKIEDLKKKSPAQQFEDIGKAIMQLGDPADRAAASMAIFGKSGGELMQVFSNPQAMQEAGKALGGQADIMAKNAATFGRVSDQLDQVGTKLMGFFAGVTESILPALESAGNFIASLDLAPIGKRLGDALQSGINILVNAFKTGQIGDLISLSLQAGFSTALDYLMKGLNAALNGIGELVGQIAAVIADESFWEGMLQSFIAVANKMGMALTDVLKGPLELLGGPVTSLLKLMRPEMQKTVDIAKDRAAKAVLDLSDKGILSGKGIQDAFAKGFSEESMFSAMSSDMKERLKELAKSLNVPISEVVAAVESQKTGGKSLAKASKEEKFYGVSKIEAASSLERIGALMGGGGPSQALARNTADTATNTRKIAVYMEKLVSIGGPSSQPVTAVYAT